MYNIVGCVLIHLMSYVFCDLQHRNRSIGLYLSSLQWHSLFSIPQHGKVPSEVKVKLGKSGKGTLDDMWVALVKTLGVSLGCLLLIQTACSHLKAYGKVVISAPDKGEGI